MHFFLINDTKEFNLFGNQMILSFSMGDHPKFSSCAAAMAKAGHIFSCRKQTGNCVSIINLEIVHYVSGWVRPFV